ncbi:hypothetical protein MRB53_038999 [Persea americana]|nr:hypothetical protein MRB53_038999 [Persea americana]
MITPKPGLLTPSTNATHAALLVSSFTASKITLLAPLPSELTALNKPSLAASQSQRKPSPIKPAKPTPYRDPALIHANATYTFHRIAPLPYLPNPSASQTFLTRLANDPGIRHAMRKHRFSVGLLTEMDPAAHTTHESRTLGLNRNHGEIIELRLRTDAGDGYRDYKTIRRTLCHELAHNVHGEHDRDFWDLCNAIEREVEGADWTMGGHRLSAEEFYQGEMREEAEEGWTGERRRLGGADDANGGAPARSSSSAGPTNIREAMAKAAEERMRRRNDDPGK